MAKPPPIKTLTVGELIAKLQKHDPETQVVTSHYAMEGRKNLIATFAIFKKEVEIGKIYQHRPGYWENVFDKDHPQTRDVLIIGPQW